MAWGPLNQVKLAVMGKQVGRLTDPIKRLAREITTVAGALTGSNNLSRTKGTESIGGGEASSQRL